VYAASRPQASRLIRRYSHKRKSANLVLDEPLTEAEKEKLHRIINNPKALDRVIDRALEGWHTAWKKTKKS
jgi:hypothetical protein